MISRVNPGDEKPSRTSRGNSKKKKKIKFRPESGDAFHTLIGGKKPHIEKGTDTFCPLTPRLFIF